jgi:hypothetical protein
VIDARQLSFLRRTVRNQWWAASATIAREPREQIYRADGRHEEAVMRDPRARGDLADAEAKRGLTDLLVDISSNEAAAAGERALADRVLTWLASTYSDRADYQAAWWPADAPCRHCHGEPPDGYVCSHCGGGAGTSAS